MCLCCHLLDNIWFSASSITPKSFYCMFDAMDFTVLSALKYSLNLMHVIKSSTTPWYAVSSQAHSSGLHRLVHRGYLCQALIIVAQKRILQETQQNILSGNQIKSRRSQLVCTLNKFLVINRHFMNHWSIHYNWRHHCTGCLAGASLYRVDPGLRCTIGPLSSEARVTWWLGPIGGQWLCNWVTQLQWH